MANRTNKSNGERVLIEVLRAGKFDSGDLYASVKIGGLVILHNLVVKHNKDGNAWLAFPSYKSGSRYYTYSYIEDDDLKNRIIDEIESEVE